MASIFRHHVCLAERGVTEPYFARGARMTFAEAAQDFGMYKLRERFPDESEAKLKEVLSWPLEVLTHLVNRSSPIRPGHTS